MMMRKKSNPWARAKYLYVLPLVAISLAAFARPEISEMSEEISAVKVNDLSASMKAGEVKSSEISKTPMAPLVIGPRTTQNTPSKQAAAPQSQNTPVLDVVEEMPQFPGGQAEMLTYLMKNVKYPKTAHENGVQGRVIVSFVVAADGSVRDGKVMRSVDPELDAEALRVVAAMPKWQPGKQKGKPVAVRFSLPVSFRLSSDKAKTDDGSQSASASQSNAVKLDAEKTLILVDGKAITNEELRQITPDKIESVSVIKGDKGVAQYGEKAKNGVIIVTTKK